uniref:Ig-like domain-containing protein n=1 Tax=Bos taurus TaxID=9913 RepID=G3MXB5_BOVIN
MATQNFERNLLLNLYRKGKNLTLVVCFLLPLEREKKCLTLAAYFLWRLLALLPVPPSVATLGQSLTLCVKERGAPPCVRGAVRGPVSRGLLSHSAPCVSESETSPSIFPLSLGNNDPAGQVVIGCLVQGFFPSAPLSVTWNQNGDSVSVRNFPAVLAGSLYTMSSQLTLPASLCPKGQSVTCQVQHLSKASKTVAVPCIIQDSSSCCVPNCEPSLSVQPPALEDLLLGSNASLTCTLSGLKSAEGASFTWNPTGGKTAVQGSPKRDSCGCYSVSSVLPGCADPWNSGQTFSCSVTHPESKSSLTATIKKDLGNTFRPQVHLLPPPSEELALNELVTLTCLVRGFSPKEVLVRWLQGNQELPREKYLTWGPLPEAGQSVTTFAVTSVLRVDAEVWKQGDTFSCMVGHEALPLAFTQKTIDRLAGKPTHVNVSVVMSEVDGVCY